MKTCLCVPVKHLIRTKRRKNMHLTSRKSGFEDCYHHFNSCEFLNFSGTLLSSVIPSSQGSCEKDMKKMDVKMFFM